MPLRYYSSTAQPVTFTGVNNSTNPATITLTGVLTYAETGFPVLTPFTLILAPDTQYEEVVEVTDINGLQLTIARGVNVDGTQLQEHLNGTVIKHGVSARDFREPNQHVDSTGYSSHSASVHGIGSGEGVVVGTAKPQTLTQKEISGGTLSGSITNEATISGGTINATILQKGGVDVATTSDISTHNSDTTSVHGIADTSLLATQSYANGIGSTAASALASHEADTTNIHGIADTSKLTKVESASAGRTIFVQSAQPTALATGDIWFQVTGL